MNDLLYKKIYHYVKEAILSGAYGTNGRIPTELELAAQFSVSRITSKRALSELEKEGLIIRVRGKGSFVKEEKSTQSELGSKDVLLLMPFDAGFELGDYARGMTEVLSESGFRLKVQMGTQISQAELSEYAGIIYYPEDVNTSLDFLFRCGFQQIPLVLLDKSLEMFAFPTVMADNRVGAHQLTQHLIAQKCQEIWFVGKESLAEVSSVRERYMGYLHAMNSQGLTPIHQQKEAGMTEEDYKRSIVDKLCNFSATKKIGLVVENDILAIQLVQELLQAGIAVPDQVAVTGFDNSQAASLISPSLTTVAQDFYRMGFCAAQQLVNSIRGEEVTKQPILVPISLYIRESSQKGQEDASKEDV